MLLFLSCKLLPLQFETIKLTNDRKHSYFNFNKANDFAVYDDLMVLSVPNTHTLRILGRILADVVQ